MMQEPVKFGKYVLLERISVGGMAEVFKARYSGVEGFQKILAIKRILPSLTEDVDFIRMFIDEAKIAGQLNHANICQIYELGRIEKSHFIAMEYIWGKDLLQISNRYRRMNHTMHFGQACYILSKACEALDYAHRKKDAHGRPMGIIHRDVTPQNILVSYEGEVKLIDFGIAKARDRSAKTAAGVLKGKFGYMSPEQVRGLPLDRRSDIFSLGIVLWEVATGHRLFDGQTDFVVLEKVRNAQVPAPSSVNKRVPRRLEAIIMKALQKDPEDRFQGANDMHKALQSFMMTQRPVYSAKMMATWMAKTFAKDIKRERIALERFFKSDAGKGRPSPASPVRRRPTMRQQPAVKRPPARPAPPPVPSSPPSPPPAPADDEEDATIIDDEGRFGPLEPVLDEPEPKPAPAAPKEPELGDEATVMLDEDESPMEKLSAQSTVMLDEDDDNRPDMQKVLNQIAESKDGAAAPGGAATGTPQPARADVSSGANAAATPASAPPAAGADGIGGASQSLLTPTGPVSPPSSAPGLAPDGLRPGSYPTGKVAPAPAKKRSVLRDLLIALPVAVVFFAGGAFAMKQWRGSSPPQKAPTQGTLVVNVMPFTEARIHLNGKTKAQLGAGKMVTFKDIAQGSHVVKVEAPGYKPAELQVKVDPGTVTTQTVELIKKRQPSTLSLSIEPAEANPLVLVNGTAVPSSALSKPIALPMDKPVSVEVLAFGYRSFSKKLAASTDKKIPLAVKLTEAEKPMIQVESAPGAATVYLDGEKKCRTPCRVGDLPTRKKLKLAVVKEGYKPQKWKFKFGKKSKGKELVVKLEPKKEKPAQPRVAEARTDEKTRPRTPSRARGRDSSSSARQRHASRTRDSGRKPPRQDRPRPRPRTKNCDSRCPHKNKGCLWANSQPRSRVYVDGRNTGRNTPIVGRRALKLRPGYHRITFVTSDGKRHKYGVRIKACKVSRLVRRLK